MKKSRLYLETSIFNFAVSDQVPEYKEASLKLLDSVRIGLYEGYISEVVLREIARADKDKVLVLMKKVDEVGAEMLEINKEIEELSEEYIKAGLIPKKYIEDALHIAIASYYEMDAIITWNFEHMVKLKTKKGIPAVNTLLGYNKAIEIITPLEVS